MLYSIYVPFHLNLFLFPTTQQIVIFDNFTTPEECQALIDLGHEHVFERSKDVGGQKFDGSFEGVESTRRTSENAWCSHSKGCREKEVPDLVHKRMGDIMGMYKEFTGNLSGR